VRTRFARLRNLRPDPTAVDRALAALLTIGAETQIWFGGIGTSHRTAVALVAPLITASVAFRRSYPAVLGVAVAVLMAAELGLWGDAQVLCASIAYFCVLYALTVWTSEQQFALGIGTLATANLASVAGQENLKNTVLFTVVMLVVILLVRRVVGDRERRAELAERERDLGAREAVVAERARIARELHDAIAHNVSMIVVQAGAERRAVGTNESSHDVLQSIEHIGRGALTEMRRLVGMLRSDAGDPRAPEPGIGDLPTLVARVCEAGLAVELTVDGEPRALPLGIDLSAYRIVQEALTNALKHAGKAHAVVAVRYGADSLELEISDDGTGAAAAIASGGQGLVGMRERVALYGGRFDAGRRQGGGFAVRVLLPIR
jgi:signal transduction histidine kinase